MDVSAYRHLFCQPSGDNCGIYHYNFPSNNLLSLETLVKVSEDPYHDTHEGSQFWGNFPFYEPFPYAVQMSFPLFCGSGYTDYARELVNKKLDWEVKLETLRSFVGTEGLGTNDTILRDAEEGKLPEGFKNYVRHFHNDPEPCFSGNYNWLYTGGCLDCDDYCNETTLISTNYVCKKPGIWMLRLNETLDKVKYTSFLLLKSSSPVLQVKCRGKEENLVISVRQKDCLSLHSVKRRFLQDPVRLWQKEARKESILICVDMKENAEEVIVADSSPDLYILGVESKTKVLFFSGKKAGRGAWSQVAFGEHGVYWAFRDSFAVLDPRDSYSGEKLLYEPANVCEECEEICSFAPSPTDSNFVYLGTTHSLLQVDLRTAKTVQKWTHMMKHSPQFVGTAREEDKEFVALQSQTVDETRGVVNEPLMEEEEVYFLSKSLPCLLGSVRESLKLARQSGVCLDPALEKRVNFAVTGMQCLKNNNGDIVLFTSNSAGDVFLSKVRKKTRLDLDADENDRETVERMKIYENQVGNGPEEDMKNLELAAMSHVLERVSKAVVEEKPNTPEVSRESDEECDEEYPLEYLMYFKDETSMKVLNLWGYKVEGDGSEEENAMSVDVKVREWMDRC